MKKLFVIFFLFPLASIAQQQGDINTSVLKYKPTIPADSTYTVITNTTGQPIPERVLLEINYWRKKEDFLWHVPMSQEIEILIHGSENN